jgi:hypothetical protein
MLPISPWSCRSLPPSSCSCFLALPQVWLAAQDPGVAGVVLHSPLLSGVRVLRPTLKYWPAWADIYPNHLLVGRIQVGCSRGCQGAVWRGEGGEGLRQRGRRFALSHPQLLAEAGNHQSGMQGTHAAQP